MSKMFYKKMTLASLLVASALVSSMANAADDSDTLALQVSGTINASPCVLILNKTALDLGSSLISDLKTSDQAPASIGVRTLQVTLSECTPTNNVELSVMGASAEGDSTLLANNAVSNAAANVGVGVWNKKDGSQVKIGGDPIVLVPGMATMTSLDFALVKADGSTAVTAGDVTTTAQIKLTFL